MRKIALSLIFILFAFARADKISAACIQEFGISCPSDYNIQCNTGAEVGDFGSELTCCQNSDECDPFENSAVSGGKSICDQLTEPAKTECFSCKTGEVWTALGCLPTDPSGLMNYLLTFGIGIAGGIAFLLILTGGFQIMTSAGNPDQLNAGRELITSAITGLILIIFSVFLLRLIGVDLLKIPRFG